MKAGYQNCLIIGHSSDDGKSVVDSFINNGAEMFEKKPISHSSLLTIIEELNPYKDLEQLNKRPSPK